MVCGCGPLCLCALARLGGVRSIRRALSGLGLGFTCGAYGHMACRSQEVGDVLDGWTPDVTNSGEYVLPYPQARRLRSR